MKMLYLLIGIGMFFDYVQLNPQYETIFNPRNIDDEGCE